MEPCLLFTSALSPLEHDLYGIFELAQITWKTDYLLNPLRSWQMKLDMMAELTLIFENWSYYCLMSTFLCTLLQYFSTKNECI